ncbi:MAG: NUDIX hydrolase [Amphritea sp.]
MRWTPHATVATIVEQDGRFLVVEEHSNSQNQLVINQPAGHIEQDESFVEAAIRETLEETRWTVKPTALLGMYVYTAPSNGITYHRYCFVADAVSHDPELPLDHGIEQALWLSRDELVVRESSLRSPLVIKCIDDYISGQRFPLDFIIEQN